MICTSIQGLGLDEILTLLQRPDIEMAEIRLDFCPLDDEEIEVLFSSVDKPLVATCRSAEDPHGAEARLLRAVAAGAAYVDLELEAPAEMGRSIRRACRESGSYLIRSWHDFQGTPPLVSLQSIRARCRAYGGDLVKIVTTAHKAEDARRVLQLYADDPQPLIAFAMGEAGRASRLDCLRLGAPFSYASLDADTATAPGQWPYAEMRQALYGGFPRRRSDKPIPMPSSKSFAQRAIVAAALAEGTSRLRGYSSCGDNESALAVARALGAEVRLSGDEICIRGIAATPSSLHIGTLHTGESGFLTRLMIPLLSVISDGPVLVTGEQTLLHRPLSGAHDIMASFGVRLYPEAQMPGVRNTDCCIPLRVAGPLIPGRAEISGKGGSQLISGLLAALPLCAGKSTLYINDPRSIPYMFMTVDVLRSFGIRINSEMEGGEEFLESRDFADCSGVTFHIKGDQRLQAADFRIEADWSGAANFLVAAAIFGEVEVSGLDTASLQADLSIMDILLSAGAGLSQGEDGTMRIARAPLYAFDTDLNHCPDLFPIVALLAAFCQGESHIRGTDRLAHKETDRAAAIVEMLTRLGVAARIEAEVLYVEGKSLSQRLLTGQLLRGGLYPSHGDHRMVMALRVAELGADSPIRIEDADCVAKSFPSFSELFLAFQ